MREIRFTSLVFLLGLVVAGCGERVEPPPPCEIGLVESIDVERVLDHLRVLSVDIGPRVASSPEEREAAEYIAGELERLGYEVEIQSFPRAGISARVEVLEPEGLRIYPAFGRVEGMSGADYPLFTPEGGVRGRIVDCGEGACPAEVEGQIALLTPGEASADERVLAAAEAGAAAAIVHGPTWRRFAASVEAPSIPFVTVNLDTGEAIREAGEVEVALHIIWNESSQNVIATRPLEGVEDAPIVIFTAHYDSVEQAPGASDNGSGTAGMLELARVLRDVPVGVELRFAAVGAEEVGLVGSRYYVRELPDEERSRIIANFNTDMIGTAGEDQVQLFVNTLDGDNLVAQSARAAREQLGYPEELLRAPYQRGASDHVPFHDAGIPAANFIWRDPETIALEPWYHHPYDTFDRVSSERLRTALRIVLGSAVQVICESPEEGAPSAN